MNTVSPTISRPMTDISPVDALWVLIQKQTKAVRKALVKRLLEEESATKAQQKMLKQSLTQAFNELHTGQAKHDARNLFAAAGKTHVGRRAEDFLAELEQERDSL